MLCGSATPARLLTAAAERGHHVLALTDKNTLAGAPLFFERAVAAGIRPLIGAELSEGGVRAVALVEDNTGYENLCRLITGVCARRGTGVGSALAQSIPGLSAGLQFLVADEGFVRELTEAGMNRRRLWLALDPAADGSFATDRLVACGRRLGLPLAGVCRALCVDSCSDLPVLRLLAAIRKGGTYDGIAETDVPGAAASLRGPQELRFQYRAFPEAIRNNRRLADRCCGFKLLPRPPVFPRFPCPGEMSARAFLRQLCAEGIRRRYGEIPSESAEYRLQRELRIIEKLGFCEYFLVVWDIVRHARARNAPVAGRGSGGSSIVAYVLGITNTCPLEHNIPFERFLHEGREDFPDLDVDFCWRIRDDVIDYVFRRWGSERVAMVGMHNMFQERMALRETMKAFGYAGEEVAALENAALKKSSRSEQILRLARRLVGLPRNFSVHPGGVVIGRKPIRFYVPVQRASKGVTITQYDKDGIEAIRLVKLDLLGNRALSTIRAACDLVRDRHDEEIDIESLPPADPPTVRLLHSGATIGCNQLESPAMRHLLRMTRPCGRRDVMKALALIRPGGASMGMKEVFVRRLRGLEPVPAGHPEADGILRGTGGVMIYEDDVTMVAAVLMDEPLPVADRFRKAIQKCRNDEARRRLAHAFMRRCRRNAVAPEYAKAMWLQMAKFTSYSFCRAHAASYALLGYACGWLKVHYPLEFWCAALRNNQSMYHPRVYVEEAKRAGIRFLLPDVNRSESEFGIERGAIRIGLNFVKGLGPAGVFRILETRRAGSFPDLEGFLARTKLGIEQARALVLCGAFDGLGPNRPSLMLQLHLLFRSRRWGRRVARGLKGLPGENATVASDYSPERKYLEERRVLGINVRKHLMAVYRAAVARRVNSDSRSLARRIGARVAIAALVEAQRTTQTTAGQPMLFITLEDEYGLFEALVGSNLYSRIGGPLREYGPYLIFGQVADQYDSINVRVQEILLACPREKEHSEP